MAKGKIDTSFDWKRDGKKVILLVILLVVLVVVWMRTLSPSHPTIVTKKPKVKVSMEKKTPPPIKATSEVKEVNIDELLSKSLFSYRSPLNLTAKRNPFSPPFSVVSAKETEKVVTTPEVTLPSDVMLTGIVRSGKETFAIIQGLDISEVVEEGDEILDGFIIEKIDAQNKRVILKKGGKRFILELRGE